MSTSNQFNAPSRIVYLGSIPYDQTEQQILDLCSNVGPVMNMKMMFDSTTGKSKGYAFIEFKDLESSASAIRNLNGYQLGNRFLKCGYASNNDISNSNSNSNANNSSENSDNSTKSMIFPNLPQGIDVNINMTTPAMMISSELSKYDKTKQLTLLKKLQDLCKKEPEWSLQLLNEYPQLTYVIAELLLTNGICQVDDLTQLAKPKTDNMNSHNTTINGNNTDSIISKTNEDKLSSDPEQLLRQKELLRQVLQLTDSDISILPDNEKSILWDLKQKMMKGEFGII
ncbi:hypothetical protein RI543_000366 [Arxiozyma heterogenica]|uniref:RRM domain-containing protein n=1 Tax=Arxiozyma heterogenica TaxID=278026 RepID=A0AAN7ZTJ3_9SACH|nr:hypothetical protein RI543_000366 [Kazachstania heterogenica]